MYEEVKTYLAALEAAEQVFIESPDESYDPHVEGECRYCIREAAYLAAWESLKASSVPLVAWIAENAEGRQAAATLIMEALPASMAVLDAIAVREEWCADWTDLRASAERAGVLPQDAEVPA